MAETSNATFDPASLPRWTRRYPEVIRRCATDFRFRANVCMLTGIEGADPYRDYIIAETRRLESERTDR